MVINDVEYIINSLGHLWNLLNQWEEETQLQDMGEEQKDLRLKDPVILLII